MAAEHRMLPHEPAHLPPVELGDHDVEQDQVGALLLHVEQAVELANDRYRSGLVDFLDVLEAERSLFTIQAQFTQSEQAVSQNLVRLYKALGGGWLAQGRRT